MSDTTTPLDRARGAAARLREARGAGLRARVNQLEADLQESRQLNRRIAELTDLVAELLVPLARREDEAVDEVLARYRSVI
jgi:hypothetical protein